MNSKRSRALTKADEEIVLRPNDRFVRAILVIIGLAWWFQAGITFIRDARPAVLVAFFPVWVAVIAALLALLIWIAAGADVLIVGAGELRVERRIAAVTIGHPKIYSIAAIGDLRVEKRVRKIKGNKSTRYTLTFNGAFGKEDLAWRRKPSDADALLTRLLTSIVGDGEG